MLLIAVEAEHYWITRPHILEGCVGLRTGLRDRAGSVCLASVALITEFANALEQ